VAGFESTTTGRFSTDRRQFTERPVCCLLETRWNVRRVRSQAAAGAGRIRFLERTMSTVPRFACPHCGKPIEVDAVLNALSSSDLARAMRDRRKRQLTPEAASEMGKKSAAKRQKTRRQSEKGAK
jgi:hypothetical protein